MVWNHRPSVKAKFAVVPVEKPLLQSYIGSNQPVKKLRGFGLDALDVEVSARVDVVISDISLIKRHHRYEVEIHHAWVQFHPEIQDLVREF